MKEAVEGNRPVVVAGEGGLGCILRENSALEVEEEASLQGSATNAEAPLVLCLVVAYFGPREKEEDNFRKAAAAAPPSSHLQRDRDRAHKTSSHSEDHAMEEVDLHTTARDPQSNLQGHVGEVHDDCTED